MSSVEVATKELTQLGNTELLDMFKTLEAPSHEEMNGEYAARLLKQPSWFADVLGGISVNNPLMPGKWQCKAFRPVDAERGRGYNSFRHFGRLVQRYPMMTLIAPSRYDGKLAYQLVYRSYKSSCAAMHMVDEVRCLEEGVYLGIGTCGFFTAQRMVPRPFLLTGPVRAYRGDIGVEASPYELSSLVPGLKA